MIFLINSKKRLKTKKRVLIKEIRKRTTKMTKAKIAKINRKTISLKNLDSISTFNNILIALTLN